MSYATRDDVYSLALPARAFSRVARPFDAVDPDTGTIRLTAHGLTSADLVLFDAVSGGSLPECLTAFQYYSPIVLGSDLFRVDGVSTFLTEGKGWRVGVDPGRRIDKHRAATAAEIDEHLTAHLPPIPVDPITGLYPQILVSMNARMAGRAAVTSLQIENAQFREAIDRLMAQEEFDRMILKDWKSGKPIQPRPVDQDDLADNAARAAADRLPVNWSTGML